MANCEIFIETEDSNGAHVPLRDSWVYWRAGGTASLLRTDRQGQVFQLKQGGDASRPWQYTGEPFKAAIGSEIDIYYSRAAKPIPDPRLSEHTAAFFHRTVLALPPPSPSYAPVSPNNTNVLVLPAKGLVRVPKFLVYLDTPLELTLWPLIWELPSQEDPADHDKPSYQTANLRQKLDWWQGNPLHEHDVSPVAPIYVTYNGDKVFIRPRERGLLIKGRIDARATSARIQFLDETGTVIPLRKALDPASAEQQEVACTIGAADGDTKPFEASVFFRHRVAGTIRVPESVDHFGPAYIYVLSEQTSPPILEAFAGHLCGAQPLLIDDFTTNHNGQARGPVIGEAEEKNVVDFRKSPRGHSAAAPAHALISAQTRARRMVTYEIVNQNRVLDATQAAGPDNPNILKPQMPMWMAEAQVVGLTRAQLEDLQARRYYWSYSDLKDKPATTSLTFEVQWKIELSWYGPDKSAGDFGPASGNEMQRPNQTYGYEYAGDIQKQTVTLNFTPEGKLSDDTGAEITLGDDGSVPKAFEHEPQKADFPVSDRRVPKVILGGINRPWGRHQNATQKESLLIEWQPVVTDGGNEVIRGGDGIIKVPSIKVYNQQLQKWSAPLIPEDPVQDDMRTPVFRIRSRTVAGTIPGGDRIPIADAEAVINALVASYFNDPAHTTLDHVALLSLDCWQQTARAIFSHENRGNRQYYRQYYERDSARLSFAAPAPSNSQNTSHFYFGHESGMPLFGPPHGYGFGQLDLPPANSDQVWSFVENIREAVRRIFEDYGQGAYTYLTTAIISQTAQRLTTARETVSRSNYPAGAAGTAQYNAARAAAAANAAAAGTEFLNLANGSALDQQRQRAIYQRELVRRYNGGREFRYQQAAGTWQWLVHTSITNADRQPYPNQVLNTNVAEPGPTVFDQAGQFGPGTGAAAAAP